MPYIYDRGPGGDRLSVTRCEEHGGLIVTAHAYDERAGVPVCIAPGDVAEVIREMAEWAGLTAPGRCETHGHGDRPATVSLRRPGERDWPDSPTVCGECADTAMYPLALAADRALKAATDPDAED